MADVTNEWENKAREIAWPETNIPGVGTLPAFSLEIPADAAGRVDIYHVPVCEATPDGYWFNLDPKGSIRSYVEPGCLAHERVLLARVRVSDTTTPSEHDSYGVAAPIVEFVHPDLKNAMTVEAK